MQTKTEQLSNVPISLTVAHNLIQIIQIETGDQSAAPPGGLIKYQQKPIKLKLKYNCYGCKNNLEAGKSKNFL